MKISFFILLIATSVLSASLVEKEALVDLFRECGGLNWEFHARWGMGDPCVSKWEGVGCDVAGNVAVLELPENNLVGTIPDSIGDLSNLLYLDLCGNELVGTIPATINNLTSIRYLYLCENWLSGTIPHLGGLTEVWEIDICCNSLTGGLPPSVGELKELEILYMDQNMLSGTIPEEWGGMTAVLEIDVAFNELVGPLPSSLGNLIALEYLGFYNNLIDGTLPSSWSAMQSLYMLELSDNLLSGRVPDSWKENMTSLESIFFGKNGFNDNILNDFCEIPSLTFIEIPGNNIYTTIPACLGDLPGLSTLTLHSNMLYGTIPPQLGYLSSLAYLHLAGNNLVGCTPESFENLTSLEAIMMSSNNLNCSALDALLPISHIPPLFLVDFSDTGLSGEFEYEIVWDSDTYVERFEKLTFLNLANNAMVGELPEFVKYFYRLQSIDLSGNLFEGEIPDAFGDLTEINLSNNPYLQSPTGEFPYFLRLSLDQFVKIESLHSSCPVIVGWVPQISVKVDPFYYSFKYCDCLSGYHGTEGNCSLCIDHAVCPGGETLIIEAGYYPTPSFESPVMALQCPVVFGSTVCNPNESYPYQCAEGHEDRLCSKCQEGFHRAGLSCTECSTATKYIFPIVVVIIVCAAVVYLLLLATWEKGSIKILLFHFQIASVMVEKFDPVPTLISYLGTAFSFINVIAGVGFGMECLNRTLFTWAGKFIFWMVVPLVIIIGSLLLYALGLIVGIMLRWMKREPDRWLHRWTHACLYVCLFFLMASYATFATRILSVLNCIGDPVTGQLYVDAFPYIPCTTSFGEYATAFPIALVCLIIYVVGIPALFAGILFWARKKLEWPDVKKFFGFFYLCYSEKFYWFEFYLLFRRLLLVIIFSFLAYESALRVFFICCVLHVGLIIQFYAWPFKSNVDNILEVTSLTTLSLNLLSAVVLKVDVFDRHAGALGQLVFVINILVSVFLICGVVWNRFSKSIMKALAKIFPSIFGSKVVTIGMKSLKNKITPAMSSEKMARRFLSGTRVDVGEQPLSGHTVELPHMVRSSLPPAEETKEQERTISQLP